MEEEVYNMDKLLKKYTSIKDGPYYSYIEGFMAGMDSLTKNMINSVLNDKIDFFEEEYNKAEALSNAKNYFG